MNFNSDFKYDLKIGQSFETKLFELLGSEIEVKRDFKCLETKNIYVEYFSRGKPSGISTSQAKWWCYWISDNVCIIIEIDELKYKCRKYLGTSRDKKGGDNNTSKGILLPLIELINK
jgi:hypothetical protein